MLDFPLLLGPMKTVIGAASISVEAWSLKYLSDTRVSMVALYLNFGSLVLAQGALYESKDKHEGMTAFLEKRKAKFTGE